MLTIVPGDLDDPRVVALLTLHHTTAHAVTPKGSAHALDLDGLRAPGIGFWAAWEGETLMAIGALRQIAPDHGEVKSMHTPLAHRGRGAGGAMVRHIIGAARARGYARLSLETGSFDYFAPARALYRRHGFVECAPYDRYRLDPNSTFMTLELRP